MSAFTLLSSPDDKAKKAQRKRVVPQTEPEAPLPLQRVANDPAAQSEQGVSRPGNSQRAQQAWQQIQRAIDQGKLEVQRLPLTKGTPKRLKPFGSITRQNNSSRPPLNLKVQRMSFQNTNWEGATSAAISSGGGGGVFIVRDRTKTPIVVKPSEQYAEESVVFGQLFQEVIANQNLSKAGGKKGRDWEMRVPDMRIADQNESTRIKNVMDNLLPDNDSDKRIQNGKNALLDPNRPTTIYAYAQGQDFSKFSSKPKGGQTGPKKGDRVKAVSQLWTNSGLLTLLGRATALDIFTGNTDRMLLFNPDNLMIDISSRTKSVTLIDNIFDQAQQGGTFGDKNQFLTWVNKQLPTPNTVLRPVTEFIADNFALIATEVIAGMAQETIPPVHMSVLSADVHQVMRDGFQQHSPQMEQWFANGLQQGKLALMGSISNVEQQLRNQNPKGRAKQVMQHLVARKLVLSGTAPETAWRVAHRASFTIGTYN